MRTPRIEIEYCNAVPPLAVRAAWMAQELLTTFTTEIGEVALCQLPGEFTRCAVTKKPCGRERPMEASRRSRNSSDASVTGLRRSTTWDIRNGHDVSSGE